MVLKKSPLLFLLLFGMYASTEQDSVRTRTVMKSHQADRHGYIYPLLLEKKSNLKDRRSFLVTTFFLQGLKSEKTGRPFLINHQDRLLIQGDTISGNFNRDVRAEWLGLPSDFNGNLSLKPTARQVGFIFECSQSLFKLMPWNFFKKTEICLRASVMYVHHQLNLQADSQIITVLNNPVWKNLLFLESHKKWGIGDIYLYTKTSFFQEFFNFNYYTGFIIPTGKKYNNRHFFPLQFGNNRRLGLNGGITINLMLTQQSAPLNVLFFLNLDASYLLRTFRKRTFNLKNKPWSCFMNFNSIDDPAKQNFPGVNVLTYKAHIKPNSLVDFSMGLRIGNEFFGAAFGYNLSGYEGERIKKITNFKSNSFGIAAAQSGLSASASTIARQASADISFVPVKELDIDLISGASPAVLNHGVFFVTQFSYHAGQYDGLIKLGFCAEFPQKNGIAPLCGLWNTIGIIW